MHTVTALLCFVVVIHRLIFPYPSGLLHWHCGNLTIAPVPAKQPWWIWINTSCEFIMNDCITTTKQSTTKPCAYFLGYTVYHESLDHLTHDAWQYQSITWTGTDISSFLRSTMDSGTHITGQLRHSTTSLHTWPIIWDIKGCLYLFKHHSPRLLHWSHVAFIWWHLNGE